jgi:chemotaxis protein MotB
MSRARCVLLMGLLLLAGCTVNFAKRSPWDVEQLEALSAELEHYRNLANLNAEEVQRLRSAKARFEQELGSGAEVGFDQRGLVARMLDQVLFDSGKAELRAGAAPLLDRVAKVLNEFPNQPVGVEGHTDSQPIKRSGWQSNQALSVARANAVLSELVKRGVPAGRLTPVGYGEARSVAPNDTPEGRQKNRRVEIVVLPEAGSQAYRQEADQQRRARFNK